MPAQFTGLSYIPAHTQLGVGLGLGKGLHPCTHTTIEVYLPLQCQCQPSYLSTIIFWNGLIRRFVYYVTLILIGRIRRFVYHANEQNHITKR